MLYCDIIVWAKCLDSCLDMVTPPAQTGAVPPVISPEEFEWIQVQRELAGMSMGESGLDKMKKKCKENPFVPLGCLFTVCVLSLGLNNFRKGNTVMSQKMMRLRIFAQGATLVSLILGVTLGATALNPNKKDK